MYVYLLHSFVLYPIRESGILKDDHSSAVWLLTMVFASIAIAIALSSPLVRRDLPAAHRAEARLAVHDARRAPATEAARKRGRRDERPAPRGESRVDPTGSRRD